MNNQISLKAHDVRLVSHDFNKRVLKIGRYLCKRYNFTKFDAEIINTDFCGNKIIIIYNFE